MQSNNGESEREREREREREIWVKFNEWILTTLTKIIQHLALYI